MIGWAGGLVSHGAVKCDVRFVATRLKETGTEGIFRERIHTVTLNPSEASSSLALLRTATPVSCGFLPSPPPLLLPPPPPSLLPRPSPFLFPLPLPPPPSPARLLPHDDCC